MERFNVAAVKNVKNLKFYRISNICSVYKKYVCISKYIICKSLTIS